MTAKAPIILLVIALLLAAYIFFFERGRPGQAELEARDGFLVQALLRDRITRIHISSGDEPMAMSREGEGFDEIWTIEKPVEATAEPERVDNYLRNWEYAIATRTLEDPSAEDIRSFGLESPTATVRFELGQADVTVSLGTGTPVDGGGYVRIEGDDQVMVVPKSVLELFDLGLEHFRIANDGGAPDLEDLLDAEVQPDAGVDAGMSDAAAATAP